MTVATVPRPRARATLPRAPKYRQSRRARLNPLGELGSWPAAVARAKDEACLSVPPRSRGVLALVLVLMDACMRERSGRCSLTRRTIAEAMGYEGRWAEESVRKLLNRAWELGEVLVYDGQGFRAPGARGHSAGVLVPVRLLQYLGQLCGARRAEVLADPIIVKALQAREDALRRELGPDAAPRPPPILYGRERLPGPEFSEYQANGPGKASSPVSCSGASQDLSPEMGPSGVAEGGGPPAAARSDGAAGAGAAGGPEAPSASDAPSAWPLATPPAPETLPSPASGPEARAAGPAGPPGAVARALDERGRVDLARLRAEHARVRALLAEVTDERNALACGRDVGGRRLGPQGPGWKAEREGAAALRALREREREIRALAQSAEAFHVAARVAWRLRNNPPGGQMLAVNHPAERAELAELVAAAEAAIADAPRAWARLFPEVRAALRPDQYGALRDLAELRCVADAGEALVFRARDAYHAERVRDLCLAEVIGHAARAVLGRELAVEVLA